VRWAPFKTLFDDAHSVLTDATGHYSIPGLAVGTWDLQFSEVGSDDYVANGPRDLTIDGSSPTVTVNYVIPQSGGLTGTVYLGDSAHPAGAGAVKITVSDEQEELLWSTTTDTAGHYSFSGLAGGDLVEFQDLDGSFTTKWWQDAYSASTATYVSFGRGVVQHEDEVLPAAGSMHGVMTRKSGAPTLFGIVAHLLDPSGADTATFTTRPDANGHYAFTSIPAGTYRLQFQQQGPPSPYLGATALNPEGRTLTVTAGQDLDLGQTPMLSGAAVYAASACFGCSTRIDITSELDLQLPDGSWEPAPVGSYRSTPGSSEGYYDQLLPGTYRVKLLDEPGETCNGFGTGSAVVSVDGEAVSSGTFTIHCVNPLLHTLDFSGDDTPDLIATDPTGRLLDYDTDGSGHWASSTVIGSGWKSINLVAAAPGLAAGGAPILARTADGKLWTYPGDHGHFGARILTGTGWQGMSRILSGGDFSGDGLADVLAIDRSGALWEYPGNGAGHLGVRRQIGSGWAGFTSVIPVGDFDNDGHADLIARTAGGQLLLYRGNGSGGWLPTRTVGSSGWQGFTDVFSTGAHIGSGSPDLMAISPSGVLWVYQNNEHGSLYAGETDGWGWSSMRIVR
jgi:hypothetical protein